MPARLASWENAWGVHPIFEMNLPEGYLREKLRLGFAKATGAFDDINLLKMAWTEGLRESLGVGDAS